MLFRNQPLTRLPGITLTPILRYSDTPILRHPVTRHPSPVTLLLLLLLLLPALASAQSYPVSGTVTDSLTGQPLAFVSIVVNNGREGGLSDIDGHFSIQSSQKPESLRLSYMGYKPLSFSLGAQKTGLLLKLSPAPLEISGVTILPGENPALRIVRKVLENSRRNDPENLAAFSCHSYSKTTAEWIPNESYYEALARLPQDPKALDSSLIRLVESGDRQHLMMMESYTRRIFMAPARSNESVLATRISGFRDPSFAPLATDLQPFSFYKDMINLNTGTVTGYQNPFGKGGIPRYNYLLTDTLYEGADSIFVISFRPAKGRSFNALTGQAWIHSHGWAIQNIIAEPEDGTLWKIRVQQQYQRVSDSVWFPSQLNYDWSLPRYPNPKVGLLLKGRSYIDSVVINPPLKASDFSPDQVSMTKEAGRRDSLYWSGTRPQTLDLREKQTYVVMDSLGRKFNLDYYTRAVPAITEGFLPIGPLELGYEKLYAFNDYEGHRVGLGLRTGEKIARWFKLGGYFGYGFGDEALKYGGDLHFRIWKQHDLELDFSYRYDLVQPGRSTLYRGSTSSYWFDMIGRSFDMEQALGARIAFRSLRKLQTALGFTYSRSRPCYDYSMGFFDYPSNSSYEDSSFTFAEASLAFRYAIREELVQAFDRRFSTMSKYPVFYFTYTMGTSWFDGEYPYHKLEAAVSENARIRNFGRMSLLLEGGWITDDVPLTRLFRGRGSRGGDISLLLSNSFQTMGPEEFYCNRYVSFYFRHNFGNFLFKTGKFKPEFIIAHNLMFGELETSASVSHLLTDLQSPRHGFFEGGLVIDNLLRLKLMNVAYLGLGVGAFYRYGAYHLDKEIRNYAFKVSFRISGN